MFNLTTDGKRARAATCLLIGLVLVGLTGCFGSRLPQTETVLLPDGTQIDATLGSGVSRLSDTCWEFFATATNAQAAPLVTICFGSNGNLEAFENNTFGSEVLGSSILFDGASHATNVPFVSYAAGTYGAETSDAAGFAFVGNVNAFAPGVTVANATATASGTFDPDNPDIMTGDLSFTIEIEDAIQGLVQNVNPDDLNQTLDFEAQRVDGEVDAG